MIILWEPGIIAWEVDLVLDLIVAWEVGLIIVWEVDPVVVWEVALAPAVGGFGSAVVAVGAGR